MPNTGGTREREKQKRVTCEDDQVARMDSVVRVGLDIPAGCRVTKQNQPWGQGWAVQAEREEAQRSQGKEGPGPF